MKNLKLIALISILALFTSDAFGYNLFNRTRSQNHWSNTQDHNDGPVGAPIDGGLLSILGAAGIGYYLIRRRKKNAE